MALSITWSLGIIGSIDSVCTSIRRKQIPSETWDGDFCEDGKITQVQNQPRKLRKPDRNVTLGAH